jgi:hypothetical protein
MVMVMIFKHISDIQHITKTGYPITITTTTPTPGHMAG